jgi:hypothetical protein
VAFSIRFESSAFASVTVKTLLGSTEQPRASMNTFKSEQVEDRFSISAIALASVSWVVVTEFSLTLSYMVDIDAGQLKYLIENSLANDNYPANIRLLTPSDIIITVGPSEFLIRKLV